MDDDKHIILHHLDDPLRILHWTLDEAAALMIPAFWGLGMERPALGLVLAGLAFWSLKKLKRRCNSCATCLIKTKFWAWAIATKKKRKYWMLKNARLCTRRGIFWMRTRKKSPRTCFI